MSGLGVAAVASLLFCSPQPRVHQPARPALSSRVIWLRPTHIAPATRMALSHAMLNALDGRSPRGMLVHDSRLRPDLDPVSVP